MLEILGTPPRRLGPPPPLASKRAGDPKGVETREASSTKNRTSFHTKARKRTTRGRGDASRRERLVSRFPGTEQPHLPELRAAPHVVRRRRRRRVTSARRDPSNDCPAPVAQRKGTASHSLSLCAAPHAAQDEFARSRTRARAARRSTTELSGTMPPPEPPPLFSPTGGPPPAVGLEVRPPPPREVATKLWLLTLLRLARPPATGLGPHGYVSHAWVR